MASGLELHPDTHTNLSVLIIGKPKPVTWTPVDRDYETLRVDLQTLFTHLGITTTQPAAA